MDKKKGLLNVGVSVGFKILLLIGSVLVRRFLIQYLGTEVNGLNSLYISIIGFLAVAELGIGSAIVFCMYKPIVEKDTQKVIALYRLIEKLYRIVGAFILIAGFAVMFFLPSLAKGYSVPVREMYGSFMIMVVSVVITYMFSAKVSLLEAYKNNYIATALYSVAMLFQYALQIAAVIIFHTFYAYLICRVIAMIVEWILLEVHTRKHYPEIVTGRAKVDKETAGIVARNVRAMFMHKIGSVLVNTADSVIISAFIGVVVLGGYTNYVTIMTSMIQLLVLFFTPLTSVVGHLYAKEDQKETVRYFNFFHMFNFALGTLFFLGYYAVITDLVAILFGEGLELARSVVFIITYNYFIQFMRNAVVLFRDATGTFYYDRWKSFIEGLVNVILSIAFVMIFPDDYRIVGVLVATIITDLAICHVIEPLMLFRHGIKKPLKTYFIKNYLLILIFGLLLFGMDKIMVNPDVRLVKLLANAGISVGISVIVISIALVADKDFRLYFLKLFRKRY